MFKMIKCYAPNKNIQYSFSVSYLPFCFCTLKVNDQYWILVIDHTTTVLSHSAMPDILHQFLSCVFCTEFTSIYYEITTILK